MLSFWPFAVLLYTTPLSWVNFKEKSIIFHIYADNSQLYAHLSKKNSPSAFEQLNKCLNDVKEWMSTYKLKFNPDKTGFIFFGLKGQGGQLKAFSLKVNILGSHL